MNDAKCPRCGGDGNGWRRVDGGGHCLVPRGCEPCFGTGHTPEALARALRRAGWFVSRDARLCRAALRDQSNDMDDLDAVNGAYGAVLAEQEDK